MKKIRYQTLESVGTIMWLITDFIWMNGWCSIAALLTIPTFILLTSACIKYNGKKKSEVFALTASALWFLMNMFWIYSDICYKDTYLLFARITFVIASVFVYIAIRESKDEDEPSDFKRLKIK